jgi:hypothetical protein
VGPRNPDSPHYCVLRRLPPHPPHPPAVLRTARGCDGLRHISRPTELEILANRDAIFPSGWIAHENGPIPVIFADISGFKLQIQISFSLLDRPSNSAGILDLPALTSYASFTPCFSLDYSGRSCSRRSLVPEMPSKMPTSSRSVTRKEAPNSRGICVKPLPLSGHLKIKVCYRQESIRGG